MFYKFITSLGGRKLFAFLLLFICCYVAYWLNKMDTPNFVSIVQWLIVAYMGGNVGDTLVGKVGMKPEEKGTTGGEGKQFEKADPLPPKP